MAAPKRRQLEQWLAYEKQIALLRGEANDLAKLQAALEAEFLSYVKQEGGAARCVLRCGFRLLIEDKRENVKWKELWTADHSSEQAKAIVAAQPTKEVLVIEPPAA